MYNGHFSLYVNNRFVTKLCLHLYCSPSVYGFAPVFVYFAEMQNIFFSKRKKNLAIQVKLPSTVFWNSLNGLIKLKWTYYHSESEVSLFSFVQFPMAFMNHLSTSPVAATLIIHLTLRKWNIFLITMVRE